MAHFDYIFCGTGASASLLLLQLDQNNLLQNLKVLLIDPDTKGKNDKTFCFWADDLDSISVDLKPFISHSWEKVLLSNDSVQSLSPLKYHHISSIDLYNQTRVLEQKYNWQRVTDYVDDIRSDSEGSFVLINGEKIRAKFIFDSRPPSYSSAKTNETHIFQSFIGWKIEADSEFEYSDAFRFMDFQIEQQGSTQFVYVLPFSKKAALVEITRFGEKKIEKECAEKILDEYVKKYFGNYSIHEVEVGCIPMTNSGISDSSSPGVITMGVRNYQIKPSTGYAFKNMYYHAKLIVEGIKQNKPIEIFNKSKTDAFHNRFAFYDSLLLDILKNNPNEGKSVFESLLKNVEVKKIFNFLDEKTDLIAEFFIFKNLPWKIFLSTLIKRSTAVSNIRPLVLTSITILLLLLGVYPVLQNYFAYFFIVIGLVTVGIPHGAVDHLLETGQWTRKNAPLFVSKYLLLSLCMGLMWYFHPTIALLFFLFYSAWHFGQADGKLWGFTNWLSVFWGAFILLYILGTHVAETNLILNSMGNFELFFKCPQWMILPWLLFALVRRNISFAITVFWLFLSSYLPLIFTFSLYFIGQHSLSGWHAIRNHLKVSNTAMWLYSLPFHLAAWLLLLFFFLLRSLISPIQENTMWAVFFIFIACISFPHAIFMNIVYRTDKKN